MSARNRPSSPAHTTTADAVLIGGGIASATLAALLSELEPGWRILVLERLEAPGLESSDAWNNAGTGHSALCELNYTPQDIDGSVSPQKAISINEQFQLSREFWAHLVEQGRIGDPSEFIRAVPHMSFVHGVDNVDYLRRRHAALVQNPLFSTMEFTTSHQQLAEWAPLISRDRPETETIAATRSADGTDVDFGALTRALFGYALTVNTEVRTGSEVTGLRRFGKDWGVRVQHSGGTLFVRAPFVFVGAGGNALPILQSSGIPEIKGFGGFPISGEWLRCTNEEIIAQHHAKVYGKASVGAPPMSVPHLDTRRINGQPALMFGPYAGWSPKFLKSGSPLDLPRSVTRGNIAPMLAVAPPNLDLMAYLASELTKTFSQRVESLREYMPSARAEDWELVRAGQRVQVIAPDSQKVGVLQFGTQLVTSADGSIGGMLGASPGASIAVEIMLRLLAATHPERFESWLPRVRAMMPSWGIALGEDSSAAKHTLDRTAEILQLTR